MIVKSRNNYKFGYSNNQNKILYKNFSLFDFKYRINNTSKPIKSIKKISHIEPKDMEGTRCEGSIPLKNFWDFFVKSKKIKHFGFSTNKDGYGNSFLKANAWNPISTSYVHDCSVMYLYNKKTQTHALYHALPDCTEKYLSFIIKTLMPEGFSMGAIIPGDSFFYAEHYHNMNNMLKLMKNFSPKAIVNVYHSTLKYPEIVGMNGDVFQIPNKEVQKQIKSGESHICDFGQASFKIIDLMANNTFEKIFYCCKNLNDLQLLKKKFKKQNYPIEVKKILYHEIDEKKNNIIQVGNKKVCNKPNFCQGLKYRFISMSLNIMYYIDKFKSNTANIFFRGFK